MPLTNAQLSADIAALIESYKDWQNLYSDWLGGTATGGPNGDGQYPLKDAQGVVSLVYCPAALASNVVGPSQQAEAWASAAEMHRQASQAAATLANSHKTFADAAKVASQDARDLTQILRDQTAGMHSNVVYYAGLISANATTTSADRIAVAALSANTANAASNAASSASSAAASANAAATFNPALFDLKADGIASSRLTGVIDIDRIPVLPSQKTYTSSGGIADLTGPQQALIGEGTIITTTDGRRWVYTSGSKTSEASYTILADVTPSWSSITDKPSTFAASPHGHVWADLIDKPTTFTPSAHTHAIADTTGLQTALDAKLATATFTYADLPGKPNLAINHLDASFADLSSQGWPVWTSGNFNPDAKASAVHTHAANAVTSGVFDVARIPDLAQSKITGLTSALSDKASASHTHDWSVITGKPSTFTPSTHTHLWADLTDKPTTFAPAAHTQDWSTITGRPDVVVNRQFEVAAGVSPNGAAQLYAGDADYTGIVNFTDGAGFRAGYIGNANRINKAIRFATDNGYYYSFDTRPVFNGATPWDAINLPGPATTNTIQQINARKVFKDAVAGTATSGNASYVDRAVEIQSLGSTSDALIAFHIPGVRGETFGVRANGDWVVSNGVSPRTLWHSGNFDPATKAATTHTHAWGDITGKPFIPAFLQGTTSGQMRIYDSNGNQRLHFYADPDGYGFLNPSAGGWSLRINASSIYFTASGTERTIWHSGNFDPATKQKKITYSQSAPTGGSDGDVHFVW